MSDKTMTIPEFADEIGWSPNSAYTAAKRGELDGIAFQIGSRWFVSRLAVERLLAEGRMPTAVR